MYNTIPNSKFGNCSCGCNGIDVAGRKVGKIFYCLNSYNTMKKKQQLEKAKLKTQLRQHIVNPNPKDLTQKEKFFQAARVKMVGVCQCGCARKSSKYDNDHFRSSCAHIFPQRLFPSIQFHMLNWVERNFWDGCHSVMDNTSMDRWVNMADWNDIKERFHELAPLLTDEERAHKFYGHLERLIYQNN